MEGNVELNDEFADQIRHEMPDELRYLVAVSGGRDSMALLHFLHAAGYSDLVVCHVNHLLRGGESDRDEELVRKQAERLGYFCEVTRVDVKSEASERKLSLETAAREVRYDWLAEMTGKYDCPRIVTAHHSDDQVETVIMNFFRGSGSRGLSGMAGFSSREVNGVLLDLIRPLLPVSREEIDCYLEARDIPFHDDETNSDDFALRNRVRHKLIPVLEEVFGRDVTSAVLKTAELARRQESWAKREMGKLPRVGNGLDVKLLREMPEAKRDRVLLAWLREEGVPDCGFDEVARVSKVLLSNDLPAKENLPRDYHVRRREGILFLEPPS